jgi:glyoxylase I family protein
MKTFTGFEHAALVARDSKALAEWYIRMFGLRVVWDNGLEPPTYLLRAPDGSVIEILPGAGGERIDYDQTQPGLRHLALAVTDFDAALSYLREHGIDRFWDSRRSEETRLIFFRDPEGNILHLIWRAAPLGSSKG